MSDLPKPGMIIDSQPEYSEIKILRNAVSAMHDDIKLLREQLLTLAGYTGNLSDISAIRITHRK